MRPCRLGWLALALSLVAAAPTVADQGDEPFWSVRTDPRHRAFLMWVPKQDGPRVIMLGCLRDAKTFTTMSYLVGEHDEFKRATFTLSNGSAKFEVQGSITRYPRINRSNFISDLTVDDSQLRALGRSLLPVLAGEGEITLTITPENPAGTVNTATISLAGLPERLARFRKVCFP